MLSTNNLHTKGVMIMGGFKDVIGHNEIIEYIQNAVKMDKVSHAYIMNGQKRLPERRCLQTYLQGHFSARERE